MSRSWGRCGPVLGQMWACPVRMLTDAYPECAHKCSQGLSAHREDTLHGHTLSPATGLLTAE